MTYEWNVLHAQDGRTPLQVAVSHSYISVVRFLVEKCAVNVDDLSDSGDTALHIACANDLMDIAMYLINSDAAPEIYDRNNKVPSDLCGSTDFKIMIEKAIMRRRAMKNYMSPLRESPKSKVRPWTLDSGETPSRSENKDTLSVRSLDISKMKRLQMMTNIASLRETPNADTAKFSTTMKKIREDPNSFDLDDFDREDNYPGRTGVGSPDFNANTEESTTGSTNMDSNHRPSINFDRLYSGGASESDEEVDRDRDGISCRNQNSAPHKFDLSHGGKYQSVMGAGNSNGDYGETRNRTPSTVDHFDDTDMSESDEERKNELCCVILDDIRGAPTMGI